MFENKKLILFDLDNTLFSFNECWIKSTLKTFQTSPFTDGISTNEFLELYRKYDLIFWDLHNNGEMTLTELRQQRLISTLSEFGKTITSEEAENFFQEFFDGVIDIIEPDDRINKFLYDLKRHHQVAIITNGLITEQQRKLAKLKLDQVLTSNEIFISEQTGYEKPHMNAFLLVAKHFNISAADTVYIGDSWRNDIEGALNAGMSVIWINESKSPANVEQFADIQSLIKQWSHSSILK